MNTKVAAFFVVAAILCSPLCAKGKHDATRVSSQENVVSPVASPAPAQNVAQTQGAVLSNDAAAPTSPATTQTPSSPSVPIDDGDIFYPTDAAQNQDAQNGNQTGAVAASQSGGWNPVLSILRIVIVLAIIVGAIFALSAFMKKSLKVGGGGDDPFLRQVSAVSLGVNKSVQVVTLLDKAYIVGVTDSNINLIGEVTDKELINAMNLYSDKETNSQRPKSFSDILNIFMPNPASKKAGTYADSMEKMDSLLKKQKSRLHNPSDTGGYSGKAGTSSNATAARNFSAQRDAAQKDGDSLRSQGLSNPFESEEVDL